jgi:dihydroflavonol-4-reductase
MITVVTGASGHVGVNLVRELVSRGRNVRVLVNNSTIGLENLPIELCNGDISDVDSLCRAFEGAEVVYHLAAHISLLMNDWSRCSAINVNGPRNVAEACFRKGVRRLVHFSSIHSLCTDPLDTAVNELRPLVDSLKMPPYDRSKAAGEKVIRQAIEAGLNAVILRPTGIIGPYDHRPSHFGQALILMASGKLPALLDGGFDWVDVRDVAKYAIRAEETAPPGSDYLLSGHWLSVKDLARTAAEIAGTTCPRFVCPTGLARLCAPVVTATAQLVGARPIFTTAMLNALAGNRRVSHDKATAELGYQPRPLLDTITDTITWFRDNGFLGKRQSG